MKKTIEPHTTENTLRKIETFSKKYANDMLPYKNLSLKQFFIFLKNVNYIPDPEEFELVMRPKITLQRGGGDCDDKTVLALAWFKLNNIKSGASIVSTRKDGQFHHVLPFFVLNGKKIDFDATYPNMKFLNQKEWKNRKDFLFNGGGQDMAQALMSLEGLNGCDYRGFKSKIKKAAKKVKKVTKKVVKKLTPTQVLQNTQKKLYNDAAKIRKLKRLKKISPAVADRQLSAIKKQYNDNAKKIKNINKINKATNINTFNKMNAQIKTYSSKTISNTKTAFKNPAIQDAIIMSAATAVGQPSTGLAAVQAKNMITNKPTDLKTLAQDQGIKFASEIAYEYAPQEAQEIYNTYQQSQQIKQAYINKQIDKKTAEQQLAIDAAKSLALLNQAQNKIDAGLVNTYAEGLNTEDKKFLEETLSKTKIAEKQIIQQKKYDNTIIMPYYPNL